MIYLLTLVTFVTALSVMVTVGACMDWLDTRRPRNAVPPPRPPRTTLVAAGRLPAQRPEYCLRHGYPHLDRCAPPAVGVFPDTGPLIILSEKMAANALLALEVERMCEYAEAAASQRLPARRW